MVGIQSQLIISAMRTRRMTWLPIASCRPSLNITSGVLTGIAGELMFSNAHLVHVQLVHHFTTAHMIHPHLAPCCARIHIEGVPVPCCNKLVELQAAMAGASTGRSSVSFSKQADSHAMG
jgi:hypothetical protein